MVGVVVSTGGSVVNVTTTAEVDVEDTESAACAALEAGAASDAEPEVGETRVESDTLTMSACKTAGSGVGTATAFAGTLSGSVVAGNELGGCGETAAGAVSGTDDVDFGTSAGADAGGTAFGTVTRGGVPVFDGKGESGRSEGTAGFIISGPATDNKSERSCSGSTGPFCRLGVAG